MRIIGTVRAADTTRVEVEAGEYSAGLAELESRIPEDALLIAIRVDRS